MGGLARHRDRRRISGQTEVKSRQAASLTRISRRQNNGRVLPRILQQHDLAAVPLFSNLCQVRRERLGTICQGKRSLQGLPTEGGPAKRYCLGPRLSSHASPAASEREDA